jgi:hypothetical protein
MIIFLPLARLFRALRDDSRPPAIDSVPEQPTLRQIEAWMGDAENRGASLIEPGRALAEAIRWDQMRRLA